MATLWTIAGTTLPALPRKAAIQVYQNRLIMGGRLVAKRVPGATPKVASVLGVCQPCADRLHTRCNRGECNCNCRMYNK